MSDSIDIAKVFLADDKTIFEQGIHPNLPARVLIAELDQAYPLAVVTGPTVSELEVQELIYKAGQRDVVEKLKQLLGREPV